jgi:hypothetical protein
MGVQIDLSDELVRQVDRVAVDRSEFVAEAVRRLLHEREPSPEAEAAQRNLAEILRLGAQKREAYERLDELEQELGAGGTVMTILRAVFRTKADKDTRAKIDDTVRTIYALRTRMDELHSLLPGSKLSEVLHLWSYEHTTSLSQQRERRLRSSG